jgi:bifunctional non-homologous end joining protein LigD
LLQRGRHNLKGAGVAGLSRGAGSVQRRALSKLLSQKHNGIVLNAHYNGDGATIYKHACELGCEGIVSKRLGSPYRSGRVSHWLKIKNQASPAVKREAEQDWS